MTNKSIYTIFLILFLIKFFSGESIHTKNKNIRKRKSKSHQTRKTFRKKYQIQSSKPINPEDLNISIKLGK